MVSEFRSLGAGAPVLMVEPLFQEFGMDLKSSTASGHRPRCKHASRPMVPVMLVPFAGSVHGCHARVIAISLERRT
jgi:hypothetical protein